MRASRHRRQTTEAETPGIVIYPNRRRLMVWIALSGIPTLLHGLGTLGMLLLMIAVPGVRDQSGAVIVLIVLLGSFFVLGTWLTRMLVHVTFSGEPMLVINQAGIRVGKVYGSNDIFLPWEEVESVSMSLRPPYKLFCVQPVDNRRFFSRLRPLMRLTCRLSVLDGPPIAIYQSFLDQSIEELLQQIRERYAHELELHRTIEQAQETTQQQTEQQSIVLSTSKALLWAPIGMGSVSLFLGFLMLFNASRQLSFFLGSAFLILSGVFFGLILTWRMLRIPILVVDDEGIASPRFLKQAKIKWEEIACISGKTGGTFAVETSPAGNVTFLTRQHNGKLVIPRSMDITEPQVMLALPQNMLPLPIDRLRERISRQFQKQLERYNIEGDSFA